ncbi:MAG TPA: efflux RND transporter permease subunit [Methylomirabilota bacterium]|nr:efflux RND transporter permease subunit [Methylomirabilota bacterium]
MQKLAEVCIKRPVFATMLVMAFVVVGAASWFRLGVDRFPSVDLPTVSVRVDLPGASTEEMETLVAQKLEEQINTIQGIQELRSISGTGTVVVIVTFALNRQIDVAAQDVRDKVAIAVRNLPRDILPPVVSKFDNDQAPVLTVALSGDRDVRELTEIADKIARPVLERSSGVGEVRIIGGLLRAINVWVDPDRLAAYQIPITSVRDAVARQNADLPGGNVTSGLTEASLRTMGRIAEPRDFNDLVVATLNGVGVRVRDIGYAEDGTKEQRSAARLNGVPTVIMEVRRQSGENTVAVIEGVKARLASLRTQVPPDVKLEVIRDQSRYIYAALHEIDLHLVLGSILASLVVLAFMRSWRSTFIAAVAIPTSVVSAFGMMWALNFTLNSVTMLALVLMVGIVIDDAIVVLENVFRFVEEKKMRPFEAAREATADIGLAVMATTFSLVVIFVPVSFMSSISGRFLYQFGLTAAVSVLVSLLVSFSLTPMMCARLLRAEDAAGGHAGEGHAASRGGFYAWLDRGYSWSLRLAMGHRWVVVAISVAAILASVPIYRRVKQEYIPSGVDESEFEVLVFGPESMSLAAMDEAMQALAREARETKGVALTLASAGGGFLGNVNQGYLYVRTVPHGERTLTPERVWHGLVHGRPLEGFRDNYKQRDIMAALRQRFRKYRDLRTQIRNIAGFNIGGGTFDIDLALRGPELERLAEYGAALKERARELGGIVDLNTTLLLDKPEFRVVIDRQRAADLRVDSQQIATALRLMVGGDEQVSRFHDPGVNDDYDVQIRLMQKYRGRLETIERLYVSRDTSATNPATGAPAQVNLAPGGGLVRLDNVVKIEHAATADRIDRTDRQRETRLRAGIAPGYGQADRIEALKRAVVAMNLPLGYSAFVTGKAREMEKTFTEFLWVFLLSVIFMYMILASQFESLVHPLTILLSLPLSVPFALFSLWYTGNTLNLYSALGILVLFGVVKKNAILQIDHMNNLRAHGLDRAAAIMQGNRDRLRPILMTTLALVAGMLPLWVGTGPGAEERRAIAVVVIGGQTLCLLLTLLVTPVAYSLFEDAAAALRLSAPSLARWRRLAQRDEQRAWRHRLRRAWMRRRPAREISGGTSGSSPD